MHRKSGLKTYWNGDPCTTEVVRVIVAPSPSSTWWCAGIAGKEIMAIKVTPSVRAGGGVHYLANDLSAWITLTSGKGHWNGGSYRSVPVERELKGGNAKWELSQC